MYRNDDRVTKLRGDLKLRKHQREQRRFIFVVLGVMLAAVAIFMLLANQAEGGQDRLGQSRKISLAFVVGASVDGR